MILLTKLNGKPFYLNSDKIEFLEAMPDTAISLESGKVIIVSESAEDVVERIRKYKRQLYCNDPGAPDHRNEDIERM